VRENDEKPLDFVFHSNLFGGFLKYNYTPKSSILMGFSLMNHPFMETLIWALKSPFFGQISDICSIP
jgi:hypothetical protein